MRAKPVLLPPPYWVRKPKTETWSLLDLYRSASLSRSSSLETLARLGWRTSLLEKKINHQHAVIPLLVCPKSMLSVQYVRISIFDIQAHTHTHKIYNIVYTLSVCSKIDHFHPDIFPPLIPPLVVIRPYPLSISSFQSFQLMVKGAYTTICLRASRGLRMNLRVRRVTGASAMVAGAVDSENLRATGRS